MHGTLERLCPYKALEVHCMSFRYMHAFIVNTVDSYHNHFNMYTEGSLPATINETMQKAEHDGKYNIIIVIKLKGELLRLKP